MKETTKNVRNRFLAKLYAAGDAVYDRMMSQSGSRSAKITLCTIAALGFANNVFAATTLSAQNALNYIYFIIIGIGIIFTVIMAISTGFAFKNDSASAKAQLVGTILIPVLIGIVIYIFSKVTDVSLQQKNDL